VEIFKNLLFGDVDLEWFFGVIYMMRQKPEMNTNDKLLILLAKQGNESAFRELYETNYEMIYRLAYRYVKSQPDAEDILQETFIKAFKAIQKFDFNISSNFSAWIYQICVRCSYDFHRNRKKENQIRQHLFQKSTRNRKHKMLRRRKWPSQTRPYNR